MPQVVEELALDREMRDLRDTWQGRALAAASGTTAAVLLSVLAHNYDPQWIVLASVVKPITWDAEKHGVRLPALTSAGRVHKTGAIVADVMTAKGFKIRHAILYASEMHLRDDFRRLADKLKLSDAERAEMFSAVQRWVVADYRLDPTFDPKDPDAKRLVH